MVKLQKISVDSLMLITIDERDLKVILSLTVRISPVKIVNISEN